MDFVSAIKSGFNKYAVFSGVASRSEFWYWISFLQLVSLGLNSYGGQTNFSFSNTSGAIPSLLPIIFNRTGVLGFVWGMAILLPTVAVSARRLRDAGLNPKRLWLLTISALPILATGVLMALSASKFSAAAGYSALSALLAVTNFEVTTLIWVIVLGFLLMEITFGIMFLIWFTRPSQSAAQGNKYLLQDPSMPAPVEPDEPGNPA